MLTKNCEYCGKEFAYYPSNPGRRFCCRSCYDAHHAAPYTTTVCKACDKSFTIKECYKGRYTYCSEECRKATYRGTLCGVYAIRNNVNGMVYVGSSGNVYRRWLSHKNKLKMGTHENPNLQREYDIFGVDNFTYEILERTPKSNLHAVEQGYLDDAIGQNTSYNVHPKADSASQRTLTSKQKAQISERLKGRVFSEEHRQKLSMASRGRPKSPRAIEAVRLANTDRKATAKQKQAQSERVRGIGNGRAKLTEPDVREIKGLLLQGLAPSKIALRFHVGRSQINRIKKGESWMHIV